MATFRGVVDFLLRKVGKKAVVRKSSSLFLLRIQSINGWTAALHGKIRTNSTKVKDEKISEDKPIAYSKSPAQKHRVNDTLEYDSSKLNPVRSFIIAFSILSSIVYFGFIYQETEAEQKIFEKDEIQENLALQTNPENIPQSEKMKR